MKTNITSIINRLFFGITCMILILLFMRKFKTSNPQPLCTTVQTCVYTSDTYTRDTITMLENGLLPECYE